MKPKLLLSILFIGILLLSACGASTTAPPAEVTPTPSVEVTPTPPTTPVEVTPSVEEPEPTPDYYPFESWEDREAAMGHAKLLVIERIQSMARSHEGREYVVALLSARSWGLSTYSVEMRTWLIVLHGFLPDNWQSFTWLPNDYIDTLEEYWHGGPNGGADWVVYDSGKIIPLANGFRVEADIEQLNTTRTLK